MQPLVTSYVVLGRPEERWIYVSGSRQSGKTTVMIDIVSGAILARGTPVVVCKTRDEASRVTELLVKRLESLGVVNPIAAARRAVVVDKHDGSFRGGKEGPFFEEEM